MTLPTTTPIPGGLLADVLAHWSSKSWEPGDLARFRMADDDGLDGLSDDELDALETLSDDDVDALRNLTPEALAKLKGGDAVDEDALPDPVKSVLKKERGNARDAKRARRTAEAAHATEKARADRLQAEIDRLKKKPPSKDDDGKPDTAAEIEAARQAAQAEAEAKANERIIRAEVKAAAAGKFADPSVAVRLVDLSLITVDANGDVDEDAIAEQFEEILEKTPALAAKAKRKPKPNEGQGKKSTPHTGADAGRAEAERRFGKREAAGASK